MITIKELNNFTYKHVLMTLLIALKYVFKQKLFKKFQGEPPNPLPTTVSCLAKSNCIFLSNGKNLFVFFRSQCK